MAILTIILESASLHCECTVPKMCVGEAARQCPCRYRTQKVTLLADIGIGPPCVFERVCWVRLQAQPTPETPVSIAFDLIASFHQMMSMVTGHSREISVHRMARHLFQWDEKFTKRVLLENPTAFLKHQARWWQTAGSLFRCSSASFFNRHA